MSVRRPNHPRSSWTTDKVAWAASVICLVVWAGLGMLFLKVSPQFAVAVFYLATPTLLVVLSVRVLRRSAVCAAGAAIVAALQSAVALFLTVLLPYWRPITALLISAVLTILFVRTFVRLSADRRDGAELS